MNTPVYDFAKKYAAGGKVRLHMPGHKGVSALGCEALDLTEIPGADELFAPAGIIAESEENAGKLFRCRTLYSTEGSSHCIRAMLYLALLHAAASGRPPVIAAARNAHRAFLTAAMLLGFEIVWLPQSSGSSYLSFSLTESAMQSCLPHQPAALYLTSPDYLGNLCDIPSAADFCRRHNMLLLVDNAHGAYLRFLQKSLHPSDCGADLCCDSAHKTLPVLTGGAYLHIADSAPAVCFERCRQAMALFGSTSPSYLILESLDLCNRYLSEEYPQKLQTFLKSVRSLREKLSAQGWSLCGSEPLKLTLRTKPFGYSGGELDSILQEKGIFCEFADTDYLVMMLTPELTDDDLHRTECALLSVQKRPPLPEIQLPPLHTGTVLRPREFLFAETEILPVSECAGRICAETAVSCPPAVPLVLCGERMTPEAAGAMRLYGKTTCAVVKE
ncbi:MAG: amino acid decarboxylase [Oscillospiraceae bacterium]|nr:amino acid decarboxylase [Oscillospiraceae bacterium]